MFLSCALHPPWSPTRGRFAETDLQFPAPKLHNYHTRRAKFQSNSDHLRFKTNEYKDRCIKRKKEITFISRPTTLMLSPSLKQPQKNSEMQARRLTLKPPPFEV